MKAIFLDIIKGGLNMITEDLIQKIEKAFGFSLYDWKKDYLLDKMDYMPAGRGNGKTFVYCLKLLLSDGEAIRKEYIYKYRDGEHGASCKQWFRNYCLEINDILTKNGFKTRIII